MRQDQTWIISKNPAMGIMELYPLTKYDTDEDFESRYMDGRFGGIPRIRRGV